MAWISGSEYLKEKYLRKVPNHIHIVNDKDIVTCDCEYQGRRLQDIMWEAYVTSRAVRPVCPFDALKQEKNP